MKHTHIIKYCFLLFFLFFSMFIFADNRFYVWTYEYKTMEKGKAELEYYLTFSSPDLNNIKNTLISIHQIEIEVGMTDKFDIGIYQVFQQSANEPLLYKEFKIRGRYRIGEKNKYFLDPLIYLEYKNNPNFTKNEIEFKLILAKDIGKFNISLNPIFEFEKKDSWEAITKYALGISYEVNPILRFGFEVKGSKDGNYIGPVISHGKNNAWVALGSAFKISHTKEGKPEFQIRMLMGLEF